MRCFQCLVICLCMLICHSCSFFLLPPLEVVSAEFGDDVLISFSANPSSVSIRNALTLTEDGSTVNGSFEFTGKQVRYIPENGIRQNRNYELSITTAAEDEKGNSLRQNYKKQYTTRSDILAPVILRISPADEENCAVQPQHIQMVFSKPVDIPSFYSALQITPKFDYVCEFSRNGDEVSVVPVSPLVLGTRYTVTVTTALTDKNKNALAEKYTSTFLYGLDKQAPDYTLTRKNAHSTALLDAGRTAEDVPSDTSLILQFDEKIVIDSISRYISIFPETGLTIVPDKETETSATISFSKPPEWGKLYELTIKQNIADISGNKIEADRVYSLVFNNEDYRPVSVIKGYIKNGSSFYSLSEKIQYGTLTLNVSDFPTVTGSNDTPTDLYVFFRISNTAGSVSPVSAMQQLGISTTNGCADFTLKTLNILSDAEYAASEVYTTANADPDIRHPDWNICVVKIGLEVSNTDKRGLVTFSIGKDIADTLGNTLSGDFICIVNKQ